MKLGLSFSRCLRDLIDEKVMYDDVLVIVARTDFDPHNDNDWNDIWYGYTRAGFSYPEWRGYEDRNDEFRRMAVRLYDGGKLHQPRQYKLGNPVRFSYYWLDLVVPIDELEELPAVKQAWEHYQMVANLCS